jgi:glycosyltransferase involved in cell wall biosynthesis
MGQLERAPARASVERVPGAGTELVAAVVVPVRDGGDDLRRLLEALAAQTVPPARFEVLVADDGSVDDLAQLTEPYANVRLLRGPRRNAYAARNRAASVARAPVLVFCDADCRPGPRWLESGLAALEHAELAAGLIRFAVPERRTVWSLLDVDTFKDHARQVQAANAETANLFVSRELFERAGGFADDEPAHGDFDFVQRCVALGGRLVYAPEADVEHPTRDRARPFLRNVWEMHRSYAAREARAGRLPDGLKLRSWVPLVQPLRARRRFGRSLRLDRRRLSECGVQPRLAEDLAALPLMYLLLPYVGGAAQLRGWRDARRR